MDDSSRELWQELSVLADAFAGLGRMLLDASRQLHAPGLLPPPSVYPEIGRLRGDFDGLRVRAVALADLLGVAVPSEEDLQTIRGLALLLEAAGEAEERREEWEQRRRSALAVLDRVLRLTHTHNHEFAPLLDCQSRARSVRDEIALGTAEEHAEGISGLAENDHPFAYLLAMVEGIDGASDDLWENLFDSVGRSFGRSLAAAVARSRVVAGDCGANSALAFVEPEPVISAPSESLETPLDVSTASEVEASWGADAAAHVPPRSHLVFIQEAITGPGREAVPAPVVASYTTDVIGDAFTPDAASTLPRALSSLVAPRRLGRTWRRKSLAAVERPEPVRLLSGNVISGYVFLDAKNDGSPTPNESPIAGNTIELLDAKR